LAGLLIFCLILPLAACGSLKQLSEESAAAASSQAGGAAAQSGASPASDALAGLDKSAAPEITGVAQGAVIDFGTPGVDFKELPAGPADDWGDVPAPFFNPRGSKALYDHVAYYPKEQSRGMRVKILDGYTENVFSVGGEHWDLEFTHEDATLNFLGWCAKNLNAEFYPTTGKERTVFKIRQDDNNLWWGIAEKTGYEDQYRIMLDRLEMAAPDKPLVIKPAEQQEPSYKFWTACTPGKLQSATLKLKGAPGSGFELHMRRDNDYGAYKTIATYDRRDFNNIKTDTYVLDDIPPGDGEYEWTVVWDDPKRPGGARPAPDEISFEITDAADITPVKWGGRLGALKLVGVPAGVAQVFPADGFDPRFGEVGGGQNTYSANTADEQGNQIFPLPAGITPCRWPV
jgi:hypothetical protein